MTKQLFTMRIEKQELDKLKGMAAAKKETVSVLVRCAINNLIINGTSEEVKRRVKLIVNDLIEPFVYVNFPVGREFAKKERRARQVIADKLCYIFGIK